MNKIQCTLLFAANFAVSFCCFAQNELDTLYHHENAYNLVLFKSDEQGIEEFKQQDVLLDRKNRIFHLPDFLGTGYTYRLQYTPVRNVSTWAEDDCFEVTPLNYSLASNDSQTYYYFWDYDADDGDGAYIQWQYNDKLRAVQSYWYKAEGNDIYSYIHTYLDQEGKPSINIRLFLYIYFDNGTSAWHCMDIYAKGKLD